MPTCPGKVEKRNCLKTLYRCKKCGNIGCDRSKLDECTNQAFRLGRCLRCGSSGKKETFR